MHVFGGNALLSCIHPVLCFSMSLSFFMPSSLLHYCNMKLKHQKTKVKICQSSTSLVNQMELSEHHGGNVVENKSWMIDGLDSMWK